MSVLETCYSFLGKVLLVSFGNMFQIHTESVCVKIVIKIEKKKFVHIVQPYSKSFST